MFFQNLFYTFITSLDIHCTLRRLVRDAEVAGSNPVASTQRGCRTGFYLLVRDLAPEEVLAAVKEALAAVVAHDGEMFGGTRKECGNYRELSLASAKAECDAFLAVLESHEQNFIYPTK